VVDLISSRGTGPLSAFNGYALNPENITGITAVDSNGATITLRSAGFMILSGVTTQEGDTVPGRMAIPVFKI
jgi:hypothetical protein